MAFLLVISCLVLWWGVDNTRFLVSIPLCFNEINDAG